MSANNKLPVGRLDRCPAEVRGHSVLGSSRWAWPCGIMLAVGEIPIRDPAV